MFSQSQYSRIATAPARVALVKALCRHVEALRFGTENKQFARVFEEWANFADDYMPPSACVLPGTWEYVDAVMTPTLLEDTWEPAGQQGFGLYKLAEMNLKLEIAARTDNTVERDEFTLAVESSFRAPRMLMDQVGGGRYGIILPLPEYYGLTGRFAMDSARYLDSEDPAVRNQRDAIFTVSAQCAVVTVGPVYPLNLTTRYACPCQA